MLANMNRMLSGFFGKLILAILIISFAGWGVGDMISAKSSNPVVAKVGSTTFTRADVERDMQQNIQRIKAQLGANYNPEILSKLNMPEQVTIAMVNQEVIKQESKDLGIIINDQLIAEMIRGNPAFADDSGTFNKQNFQQVLRQNNIIERDYTASLKHDMAVRLLSQAVVGSAMAPDIAINVMLAAAKETRKINLLRVNVSDISAPEPSAAELETYYQSVADRYAVPEFRSVSYVTLDTSNLKAIEVTEEELQQAYTERKAEFDLPEYRSFEQLLYSDKARAEQAQSLLQGGKTVAEVARELPPVNKGKTAIKQVAPTALPEALRTPAFALQQGEISAVIQSAFGFHVLKLTSIEPAHSKPFEEVRDTLKKDILPQKTSTALSAAANALQDFVAGGGTLADAAAEIGLTVKTVPAFSKSGTTPTGGRTTLPDLNNFAMVAFATPEKGVSPLALGKPGTYFLLHVDAVQPVQLPNIETVKAELTHAWKASKKATLERSAADAVAAKLADSKQRAATAASGDLQKIATGTLARTDLSVSGRALTAPLVQDIFASDVGTTTAAHRESDGSYVIAEVLTSTMPPLLDAKALAASEAAAALMKSTKLQIQQELLAQYMDALTEKFNVQIYHDVLAGISVEP